MADSPIQSKSMDFSIRVVRMYQYLTREFHEFVLSKQLLRSGTAIAANIREARYAQSRRDFVSKLSIALKEASETQYWLDLLYRTDYLDAAAHQSIITDCDELVKLLTSIVKSSKLTLA